MEDKKNFKLVENLENDKNEQKMGAEVREKINEAFEIEDMSTDEIQDVIKSLMEVDIFKEIVIMLTLNDKEFNALAPVFTAEIEKSLSSPKDKMLMTAMFEEMGVPVASLRDFGKMIELELDETLKVVENLDETEKENFQDNVGFVLDKTRADFIKNIVNLTINAATGTSSMANRLVKVPIEIMENGKMPAYAHITDAGMDIYASEDITVLPGESVVVGTGIKIAVPDGYEIQIRAKSGISAKTRMRISNGVGTIDNGYKDELKILIDNIEPPIKDIKAEYEQDTDSLKIKSILYGSPMYIEKGQKIAQMLIAETPKINFYEVEDISLLGFDRGGGLGSTGVKDED